MTDALSEVAYHARECRVFGFLRHSCDGADCPACMLEHALDRFEMSELEDGWGGNVTSGAQSEARAEADRLVQRVCALCGGFEKPTSDDEERYLADRLVAALAAATEVAAADDVARVTQRTTSSITMGNFAASVARLKDALSALRVAMPGALLDIAYHARECLVFGFLRHSCEPGVYCPTCMLEHALDRLEA